jgi:hypothetical protein
VFSTHAPTVSPAPEVHVRPPTSAHQCIQRCSVSEWRKSANAPAVRSSAGVRVARFLGSARQETTPAAPARCRPHVCRQCTGKRSPFPAASGLPSGSAPFQLLRKSEVQSPFPCRRMPTRLHQLAKPFFLPQRGLSAIEPPAFQLKHLRRVRWFWPCWF